MWVLLAGRLELRVDCGVVLLPAVVVVPDKLLFLSSREGLLLTQGSDIIWELSISRFETLATPTT